MTRDGRRSHLIVGSSTGIFAVALTRYCYADGIDIAWYLTRVDGWKRDPQHAALMIAVIAVIDYILNLIVVGVAAIRSGVGVGKVFKDFRSGTTHLPLPRAARTRRAVMYRVAREHGFGGDRRLAQTLCCHIVIPPSVHRASRRVGAAPADTKLVRFGARDYDPGMGRWTNKDPIGFAGQQGNQYLCVDGDPVNRVDPSGLATWICTAVARDPFLRFFGIGHRWVRTDTMEAGMSGSLDDTYIADHSPKKMYYSDSERKQFVCELRAGVHEQCVNKRLTGDLGQHMGGWNLFNNCMTYAHDVVDACSQSSLTPRGPIYDDS